MKAPKAATRMGDEAVKAKTGRVWAEWFAILDEAGAKKWPHREMVAFLHQRHKVPSWWRQMVAVEYERARGLRVVLQKSSGEFAATGSRTLAAPLAQVYAAWKNEKLRRSWLGAAKMEVSTANENKSLRAAWDGGKSRIAVNFYGKGAGKAQVTIEHVKLSNAKDTAKMKSYWFAALNRLEKFLA